MGSRISERARTRTALASFSGRAGFISAFVVRKKRANAAGYTFVRRLGSLRK